VQRRDALFVINQDAAVSALRATCHAGGVGSALVLTTHGVFPGDERAALVGLASNVEVISFAELLTDADMVGCDAMAERVLRGQGSNGTEGHASRFMDLSLYAKNRLAHERLSTRYEFRQVRYTPGLGVSAQYWHKAGRPLEDGAPTSLPRATPEAPSLASGRTRRLLTAAQRAFGLARREVHVIREDGTTYVFFSRLRRLRTRRDARLVREARLLWPPALRMGPGSAKLSSVLRIDPKRRFQKKFGPTVLPCMTMHDYDWTVARTFGEALVFVDGYHPSNFPRSYIDDYDDRSRFVVRTMLDDRWFTSLGKRTTRPPRFLATEHFAPCAVSCLSRVLVALNCAGDWTALINRSDTDELVVAVADIARKLPSITFRIRLHPAMNDPSHEGVRSKERVHTFVRSAGLENLHVSRDGLGEDLSWCEVCLSEYSQVLLDALRLGKLGIAVNLPKRRSFMQDYADLGFCHTWRAEEALDRLQYFSTHLPGAVSDQNRAVTSYNAHLTEWLGRPCDER
jgi:hypothetical protein